MKNINLIQYLPLSHPNASMRLLKKLEKAGVMTILDLEDSIQDPFDFDQTIYLKDQARKNFYKYLNEKPLLNEEYKCPIYLRINAFDTEFFEKDIKFISELIRLGFPISGIFLPKVEHYEQIIELKSLLDSFKNSLNKNILIEIVPMIETIKGLSNLDTILENDKNYLNFSKIHYGHFDYCQDSKIWPFPDPNHQSFWEIIKLIAGKILSYKKTYIHTPFPFPNDQELFWAASRYLLSLFPNSNIWICTLNSELSFSKEPDNKIYLDIIESPSSKISKIEEAKLIIDSFLEGRANKRSFGMTKKRFIPPHQYFSAIYYLKQIENIENDIGNK